MSRTVAQVLRDWGYFGTSTELEAAEVRADFERAFKAVKLTAPEKEVISFLFFSDPLPPARDRINRAGDHRGRPGGGRTQNLIARAMFSDRSHNAASIEVTRILQSACAKLSNYLGGDYEHQSW